MKLSPYQHVCNSQGGWKNENRTLPGSLALIVLALVVSSCTQPAAAPAPTTAPAKAEQPTPQPTAAPAKAKIPMAAVTFYSDFFMQTVVAGMQKAADEQGIELTNAVSELDLAKEAKIIDDLITKGVKAILITPVSSDGSTAALKKAKDAGITIVCFNTCVNDKSIPSSFIYTEGKAHVQRPARPSPSTSRRRWTARPSSGS